MSDTPIPVADEVDGPPADDELLRRRAIPEMPVAAAPAPVAAGRVIPPVDATTDLENRGLQSRTMGTPIPAAAAPMTPATPPQGSTADLEARSLATYEHPKSTPIQTGVASLWTKAENIHNPVLRVLGEIGAGGARALDAIGTGVGRVIPAVGAVESAIPGTTMNQEFGARRAAETEAQEAGLAKTGAETEEAKARARALENPPAKEEETGKTITTDQGVMQWDPKTQSYDIKAGNAPDAKAGKAILHETDQGIFMVNPDTKEVTPLTYQGQPLMPKTPADKFKAVTLQLPGGGKAPGKTDDQGNLVLADGTPAPKGTLLYQQPNYGQMVLPTKTQTMLGPDNLQHDYSWNPQTQRYDIDQGISTTGAYGHQMEQAGAIDRAGQSLIQTIRDNEKSIDRSKLGEWSTWVKKYGLDTPFADPTLAGIQAEFKSFADLNPALHGYRSAESAHSFEQLVGGLQKNPEAAIASIQGLVKTGAHAINPRTGNETAGTEPTPPKAADPGMKWQHRTNPSGAIEWRQVKAQ